MRPLPCDMRVIRLRPELRKLFAATCKRGFPSPACKLSPSSEISPPLSHSKLQRRFQGFTLSPTSPVLALSFDGDKVSPSCTQPHPHFDFSIQPHVASAFVCGLASSTNGPNTGRAVTVLENPDYNQEEVLQILSPCVDFRSYQIMIPDNAILLLIGEMFQFSTYEIVIT